MSYKRAKARRVEGKQKKNISFDLPPTLGSETPNGEREGEGETVFSL